MFWINRFFRESWRVQILVIQVTNVLINALGKPATAHVAAQLHHVNGDNVCRVHVNPSPSPVMATVTVEDKDGQPSQVEKFFVRLNNTTQPLDDPDDQATYKSDRWGSDDEPSHDAGGGT